MAPTDFRARPEPVIGRALTRPVGTSRIDGMDDYQASKIIAPKIEFREPNQR